MPTSPIVCPVSAPMIRTDGSWQMRPWDGPIVTVV